MNPADAVPFVLLMLFIAMFLGGVIFLAFATRWYRLTVVRGDSRLAKPVAPAPVAAAPPDESFASRPRLWLAVRHPDAAGVFNVLGLGNPQPSHWHECGPGTGRVFVSVPVHGWTIISGDGLPDPIEDIDRCYKFLVNLSIAFGSVQMFCADLVLDHHAWARLDSGQVIRGYAWAGGTLWNEGVASADEQRLRLLTFGYGEDFDPFDWQLRDCIAENLPKIPALAARWSLDPAALESLPAAQTAGLAGYAGSIAA